MSDNLYLKKVNRDDAAVLYEWRNEEDVRKNSYSSDKIKYENHIIWLENALRDETIKMFILMNKDIPIGQIRINLKDGIGTISYSIDNKQRGNGYGKLILRLLEKYLIEYKVTDCSKLVGIVKENNIASKKAFISVGYKTRSKAGYLRYIKDIL